MIVIGAGMAGLVAAFELARQGHDPLVLEAQNRVGGRVYTLRTLRAGAVRRGRRDAHPARPRPDARVLRPVRPPAAAVRDGQPQGPGPHRRQADDRRGGATSEPDRLPFDVAEHERGRSVDELWEDATRDLRELLEREGDAGWDADRARSTTSTRSASSWCCKGFSEGAIEMYGVINFVESDMNNAVIEELREDLGRAFVDMQEIVGGMDLLPRAFYGELQDRIRFGAEVFAIDQDADSVTVHFKTEAGRFTERADYAICAIPFSVLRQVEQLTPFSREKQRAIRQLNYSASTKILFQVSERVWEADDGIFGGATVTDLPIRRINYPTPDPTTSRGVLLASLHVGPGRAALGRHGRGDAAGGGARRRRPDPPADPRRVRGRRLARLVRRPLGERRVRPLRPGAADRAAGRHRPARGPDLLRRRALLAVPRLDPGSARVRDQGRAGDPRGAAERGVTRGRRWPRELAICSWGDSLGQLRGPNPGAADRLVATRG